jgi:hypothetical protein
MSPAKILAVVDNQLAGLQRQLDTQLTRTAQLQQQIDRQHREALEIREHLGKVHGLLKELVTGV